MKHYVALAIKKPYQTVTLAALMTLALVGAVLVPFAHADVAPDPTLSSVGTTPFSGTRIAGQTVEVFFQESHNENDLVLGPSCKVNGVEVAPLENLSTGMYKVVYTVGAGDTDQNAGMIPINCTLQNPSGSTTVATAWTDNNTVAIDANNDGSIGAPVLVPIISDVSLQPNSGTSTLGSQMSVFFQESHQMNDLVLSGSCKVNDREVSPLQNLSGGLYKVVYTVGANDYSRDPGQVPVYCNLGNSTGSVYVSHFTDGNTTAISHDASTGTSTATSTDDGSLNGTVTGGIDANEGVLALTSVAQTQTNATADGTFENGWRWTFHVTVPMSENSLQMKFANWIATTSSSTIQTGNNMRISSAQATSSGTVMITAADTYSSSLVVSGDLDAGTPGRQVDVIVEMRVPTGSVNGSYSTGYGMRSF